MNRKTIKKPQFDMAAFSEAMNQLTPGQRQLLAQSQFSGMSRPVMDVARQLKANYDIIVRQKGRR